MPRQLKTGYFVIEGLNSFGTTYYFYYFYFFMQQQFGFGDKANLLLAALNGFIYVFAAWWGGRFAQRAGYFTALKVGFAIMIGALLVGAQLESAAGQIMVMVAAVIGMCFTWPTLEALVSEGETPLGLQRMVGIYNVVWAATGAIAYFIGGALLDQLGLRSMFFVPATVFGIQLALTLWLERGVRSVPSAPTTISPEPYAPRANPRPIARTKMFLRLAWLANPFAYIAINTLVAVMPGVAQRLELSTTQAGFFCSVWCFARLGAFWGLWFWPGWHYRFRWLVTSYLALLGTFVLILTVPSLPVLVLAQLVLGAAIGLIYYSSLFYSMDVGETKGEHGGIHEAAIGLGNFAGPAVGAASLHFLPHYANSGALAVSALLLCGLGGLLTIRFKTKT
ncbi:MAG: MFS transporter [Verrucomicrobiae bacterium]|nr:MFS transporter [Verrucomicrobiae bacterium]